MLSHNLIAVAPGTATVACGYTDATTVLEVESTVLVTMRSPVDGLYQVLSKASLPNLARIGDCLGPSTIAAAVYSGHRFARELGEPEMGNVPFRRELPALAPVIDSERQL
jgi:dimethylamine/trimethylamine dehydrogenase